MTQQPDIEIRAKAEIEAVDIRSGTARISITADPGVAEPVVVERSAPAGRASYRNLTIGFRAIARLTGPKPLAAIATETGDTP